MRILKNQIIAKEGVLTYGNKRLLKRWSNLEQYIGITRPITDDHPPGNRVRPDTKIYGKFTIKKCPLGANLLCADLELNDDAPERLGYSIGFGFRELAESGKFHAEHFDGIQELTEMDHLALTDQPRESISLNDEFVAAHYKPELQSATNVIQNGAISGGDVNICVMGIDSFKFDQNAQDAFKSSSDSDHIMGELEDLKKQLEEIKKTAGDAVPKTEYEKIKAENAAFKKAEIDRQTAEIQSAIDSLKKEWEFSDKDLEGHDAAEIKGAKWALDLVKETSPRSTAEAHLIKNNEGDAVPQLSRMVYEDGKLKFK